MKPSLIIAKVVREKLVVLKQEKPVYNVVSLRGFSKSTPADNHLIFSPFVTNSFGIFAFLCSKYQQFWKWNDCSAVFCFRTQNCRVSFEVVETWRHTSPTQKPACGLLCQVAQRSLHFRLDSYRNKRSTSTLADLTWFFNSVSLAMRW